MNENVYGCVEVIHFFAAVQSVNILGQYMGLCGRVENT